MTTEQGGGTPPFDNSLGKEKLDFISRLRKPGIQTDPGLQQLAERINGFPPKAKDYLRFLTNTFLEEDIWKKTMEDPGAVEEMRKKFQESGVEEGDINSIVTYFNNSMAEDELLKGKRFSNLPEVNNQK